MPTWQQILRGYEEINAWFPLKRWPEWARRYFHNRHKDRKQRMQLWLVLWKSGMTPERAVYFVMFSGTYDRSAWLSMNDLVKKTKTPEGRTYLARFPVIDLTAGFVDYKGSTGARQWKG